MIHGGRMAAARLALAAALALGAAGATGGCRGCGCASVESSDSGAAATDAGDAGNTLVDAGDAGAGCDAITGEGCTCAVVGDVRACTTGAVGACGMGTQTCALEGKLPTWGPCGGTPAAMSETCNGLDDDCDGMTDEDLGDLTCGTGACAAATPACAAGVMQTCVPGTPGTEVCNGVDDDCNGMTDDGLGDVSCGVGACAATVPACSGGLPGMCIPGLPSAETCNGADDDCNGMTDEGLGSTSCGMGECAVTVPACTGGAPTACVPGMPSMEVCDGLDNDCNGTIDDGFGTTVCGVGECQTIVIDCSGSGTMTCVPGTPTTEVCDGLDNDCDGTADDGIADVSCGTGACARTVAGCTGGTPGVCTPGLPSGEACDGADNDCDGMTDEGLAPLVCGVGACETTVVACMAGVPSTCTAGTPSPETCGNAVDDDCDGMTDEFCGCDPTADGDFDGFNECTDCDDTNGGVYPGQTEACNGLDDDCDGLVDETFDADGDGFGTCSPDPMLFDCDDGMATVHPGATETCGPAGLGDGIDQDCDGYVDETCAPCTTTDADMDGVSECGGDCDDADPLVAPGLPEVCDGVDTDCNVYTTENCGVSDPCNFPGDADVCEEDLLCGCVVTGGGTCTGTYVCTSFCEGSFTGALGAGCTATETCLYRVTLTDNQHGCAESTGTIGTLGAGAVCTSDAMCRSGNCDNYCVGPGCMTQHCVDYCDHDDPGAPGSCAAGTVCEIVSSTFMGGFMYGTCRLDDNGSGTTGAACTGAGSTPCRWGTQSCVAGVCAEPCGINDHCPSGYHCSLRGNSVTVGTWGAGSPAYITGLSAIETVPVCLVDSGPGLHDRQSGAACSQNGDCVGQFCEATLGVCIDTCTTDADCPTGLTCELEYVRTPPSTGGVTLTRVCMNASVDGLLESM
jgi:hypothetical protein